jgi:hypothetical protein
MLILGASTDKKLQVVTAASASIRTHVSWIRVDTATPPVVQDIDSDFLAPITTAATTDILAGTVLRKTRIGMLSLRNEHGSTSCGVLVQAVDGTHTETLIGATLLPSETLLFTGKTWTHFDSDGLPKSAAAEGGASAFTELTDVPATITHKAAVVGNNAGTALVMTDNISVNESTGMVTVSQNSDGGVAIYADGAAGLMLTGEGVGGITVNANGTGGMSIIAAGDGGLNFYTDMAGPNFDGSSTVATTPFPANMAATLRVKLGGVAFDIPAIAVLP